jgi:hypothetical protein
MNEMVERLEKALMDEIECQSSLEAGVSIQGGKLWISEPAGLEVGALARAMVATIREPTEAMLKAGADAGGFSFYAASDPLCDGREARKVFCAMIDAAFSGESGAKLALNRIEAHERPEGRNQWAS